MSATSGATARDRLGSGEEDSSVAIDRSRRGHRSARSPEAGREQ